MLAATKHGRGGIAEHIPNQELDPDHILARIATEEVKSIVAPLVASGYYYATVEAVEDDALGFPTRGEWDRRHFTSKVLLRRRDRLPRAICCTDGPFVLRVDIPLVRGQLSHIAPQQDFRGQCPANCQELPTSASVFIPTR